MPEQAFSKKTILITGATDGLGLILLRKLVQMGHDVIGTGRRKRKELPEGWPKEAHYIQADQNKSDVADTIAAWLEKKGLTDLDLLI